MANDRILAIDGKPIETWQEMVDAIRTTTNSSDDDAGGAQ